VKVQVGKLSSKAKIYESPKLNRKLDDLSALMPLSPLSQELMGEVKGDNPQCSVIASVSPKVLTFNILDPDIECGAKVLITNSREKMELFKVKTTNPYLFRVHPAAGYLYPKETIEILVTLLEGNTTNTCCLQLLV